MSYIEKKQIINEVLGLSKVLIHELKNETLISQWNSSSEAVNEANLRISVIGEFNNGKSTFINGFLSIPEKNWLYMDMQEATSVLTEIKYGAAESGIAYRIGNEEKVVFELKDLKDYTATKTAQELYSRVEVFLPNEQLKEGITLIDTPGVDSINETNLRSTLSAIGGSHVAIFVTTKSEITPQQADFILNSFGSDIGKMFIVFNPDEKLDADAVQTMFRRLKASVHERLELILKSKSFDYDFSGKIFCIPVIKELREQRKNSRSTEMEAFKNCFWEFVSIEKSDVLLGRSKKKIVKMLENGKNETKVSLNSLKLDTEKIDEYIKKLNDYIFELKENEKSYAAGIENIVEHERLCFGEKWRNFLEDLKMKVIERTNSLSINDSTQVYVKGLQREVEAAISNWLQLSIEEVKSNLTGEIKTYSAKIAADAGEASSRISFDLGDFQTQTSTDFDIEINLPSQFEKILSEILIFVVIDLLLPGGPLWAILARILGKNAGDKVAEALTRIIHNLFGPKLKSDEELKSEIREAFMASFSLIHSEIQKELPSAFRDVKYSITKEIQSLLSGKLESTVETLEKIKTEKSQKEYEYNSARRFYEKLLSGFEQLELKINTI